VAAVLGRYEARSMGVPFGTDDTALEGQLLETAHSASPSKGRA
jgi:hypothetical protein